MIAGQLSLNNDVLHICMGGVGHELVMLAESFPDDRQIIGIDIAEGMVDLANARCAEAGIRSASLMLILLRFKTVLKCDS